MKGVGKYNAEGYRDSTAQAALNKILREERKAAKAAGIRLCGHTDKTKKEAHNGQRS